MLVIISILHDKRQCMGQTLWPLNTESYNFEDILRSESWSANIYMFVQLIFANTQTELSHFMWPALGLRGETVSSSPTLYSFFFFQYFRNRLLPRGQLQLQTGFLDANPEIQTVVDTHLTFIAVIPLTVWSVTICSLFRSINRFHRNHKITITLNSI